MTVEKGQLYTLPLGVSVDRLALAASGLLHVIVIEVSGDSRILAQVMAEQDMVMTFSVGAKLQSYQRRQSVQLSICDPDARVADDRGFPVWGAIVKTAPRVDRASSTLVMSVFWHAAPDVPFYLPMRPMMRTYLLDRPLFLRTLRKRTPHKPKP